MGGHNFINLTGRKINCLTVIRRVENKSKAVRWLCKCDCGSEIEVDTRHLVNSDRTTKSCRDCFWKRFAKHGQAYTKEYHSWQDMKSRCDNHKNSSYKDYGGRGIKYCEKWAKFENFISDMGKMPTPKHTIERKDVNGCYERSNCIWATKAQQARNNRRNRVYTINGVSKCLIDWCAEYNISYQAVWYRMKRGVDPIIAITNPKTR